MTVRRNMYRDSGPPALSFVLKVASRCNLNCGYCYVYNKGDTSWRNRPALMSDEVFEAALDRIRRHIQRSSQRTVDVAFHGGEPSLVSREQFSRWCERLRTVLGEIAAVNLSIQTNATLLDHRWVQVLRRNCVRVGVSIDGPPQIHDTFRVDHRGRGSHDAVVRGVELLRSGGVSPAALTVIQCGVDGLQVHRHLRSLGFTSIHYLLPDFTHDTIGPLRRRYGPTPCADYLLPILDYWWENEAQVRVGIFWHLARLILGGTTDVDYFGSPPLRFMFIESDGSIEGLDVLRVCHNGIANTGLNVRTEDFAEVANTSPFYRQVIFDGLTPPAGCAGCREAPTCGGGYLPHRYSRDRQFDNRSIWCADILLLFDRFRALLEVSVAETHRRQNELRACAQDNVAE